MITPSQLLAYYGGACLEQQYGALYRRTIRPGRGGRDPALTLTRATVGWHVDRAGRIWPVAAGLARVHWIDLDGNGVPRPCLLIERQRTNLMPESDDISSWSVVGTPIVVDDQVAVGAINLAKVQDDDGVAAEYVYRSVDFTGTGDGVKALSFLLYPDSAGQQLIVLRDTGAAADRLSVTVTWAGALPNAAASVGQVLKTVRHMELAAGVYVYRVECATAAVTAANSHEIRTYPAGLAGANTGVVFLGGVQPESGPYPTSCIPTDGTTVTRNADDFSPPFYIGADEDLTIHVVLARPNHADFSGTLGTFPGIVRLGASNPSVGAYFDSTARQILSVVRDAAPATTQVGTPIPAGARLTLTLQYAASVPSVRQHLGMSWSDWATGSAAAFAAFGSPVLQLGYWDSHGDLGLHALLIARGFHEPADFAPWLP